MSNIRLIKVFLATPSDVMQERQIAKDVLDSINRTMGTEKGVRFEVVGWDTDSYPAYGKDAQAVINDQIADMAQFDLFVGIMWNRFGTPTPRAGSGTEEEFRRAVESLESNGRPAIMFYFNQRPYNPSNREEAGQKLKVLAFKEEIDRHGLTATYDGPDDFRMEFHRHVERWLIQYSLNTLEPPHVEATAGTSSERAGETRVKSQEASAVISNSGMWVFLNTIFTVASEVNELGDGRISLKVPVTKASEDAALRSLKPSQYGRSELIPFAHQNTGGLAKAIDATRTSTGESAVWELNLQLENLNRGFGMEMAYGNLSADELAAIRARYLLLNEKPMRPRGRIQNDVLNDTMFEVFVEGIGPNVKVKGGILLSLWKEVNGDLTNFLPLARLWSVFHLITSNTCEHILDLTLGPIEDGVMHVRFRGQRRKEYSNRDPYIIEFEGKYDLNDT